MRSAVMLVSPRGKQPSVVANQRMIAPLTELISFAALKCLLDCNASAHGRLVLVAQRSHIGCHESNATYPSRVLSLRSRNHSIAVAQ